MIDLTAIDPLAEEEEEVELSPYWHKRRRFMAIARRLATAARRRARRRSKRGRTTSR